MNSNGTAERIVLSALRTFLTQGVKRSALGDIAYEAGVTRITIYRYFGDKEGIVAAACRHVAGIFRRAAEGSPADSTAQIDIRLKRMGEELARLPTGNLLAQFEEIRRLYPAVYEEFRGAREAALDQIFAQAVTAALRGNEIRPGINLQVARAMFQACVAGLIENPTLIAANISQAEICETVTAVLRHGMLKNDGDREAVGSSATGVVENAAH